MPDALAFPDEIAIAGHRLAVDYRFDPGAADDGATLEVPLGWLPALDDAALAWGIPGWRPELVTALIKGLPKSERRPLVPAPASAAQALREMDASRGFWTELARVLSRIAGRPLAESLLRAVALPDYLRFNLRVIGDDGRLLGEGRDCERLKLALRGERQAALRESTRELTRKGLRRWDVGRIAATVEIQRGGARIAAYPALADEGDSAALVVVEDRAEAEATHRGGLRRLLAIALAEPLKPVRKALAHDRELVLLQQPLGPLSLLVNDVCDRAVENACLPPDTPLPRDEAAFDLARERGRNEIYAQGVAIGARAKATLAAAHAVRTALNALPAGANAALRADCVAALERLAAPRFVATTPDPWFGELARLLTGLRARVQRLGEGRNEAAQRELHGWRGRIDRLADRRLAADMQWLLAEYTVSLFAQPLGTSVPVSAKRLEQRLAVR